MTAFVSAQRTRISRRVRRAVGPPRRNASLVLLYHRVARADVDPWRLAVRPEHLSEHLEILARHTHPTTAAGLRTAFDAGHIPPRTVLVTFDDGYADLATEVAPRLAAAGVPATMFLVSQAVDRDQEFWWDALERALLGPDLPSQPLTLRVQGQLRVWATAPGTSRTAVHRDVWSTLRAEPPTVRDELAQAVLTWAGLPVAPRPTHRTLRSSELARLVADPLVEFGAHTANHPWLTGLPPAEQEREILDGRAELQALVGVEVSSFAYPHGGKGDVGLTAVQAVRRAGFTTAFLATPGRLHRRSNAHALPRVFVEDMDGEGFAALLWRYAGIRVA